MPPPSGALEPLPDGDDGEGCLEKTSHVKLVNLMECVIHDIKSTTTKSRDFLLFSGLVETSSACESRAAFSQLR